MNEFLKRDRDTYKPILLSPPDGWDPKTWKRIENVPIIVTGVIRTTHEEAWYFARLTLDFDIDINKQYPECDNMSLFMLCTALGHVAACKEILTSPELKQTPVCLLLESFAHLYQSSFITP